jgi:TatD DNase family protein
MRVFMEYTYNYCDPARLYLNVTNRCTNRCSFCVRYFREGLSGAVLRGDGEPDIRMLRDSVQSRGGVGAFNEFIWCGFGEPTFRLDLITEVSGWLRSKGARIRLNTNGHACLLHGRDVIPELSDAVDEVSVSLNAPGRARYLELCRPDPGSVLISNGPVRPASFWEATIDFLSRAPAHFKNVQASVVGSALGKDEIISCENLAKSLGVTGFRIR